MNKLLVGPVHTVHTLDGKLATQTVWYEFYRVDRAHRLFDQQAVMSKIEITAQNIRRRISQSEYGNDIQHAFVRYTRALDTQDPSVAFVKLWTTMEYLAATSDQGDLTRRVAFLTERAERPFVELMMQHLQDVRNGLVHVTTACERTDVRSGIDSYLYQLKIFVEWLLLFHLRSSQKYKTRSSAAELLDTPTDPGELKGLIKLYRTMLRHKS